MKRTLQWLFVAAGPFAIIAGYLSLSRSLGGWDAELFDFAALAVAMCAGAAVLARLTRPDPAFWLVLYVPAITVTLMLWSLVLVCGITGDCV